jgi:hypothetical protein
LKKEKEKKKRKHGPRKKRNEIKEEDGKSGAAEGRGAPIQTLAKKTLRDDKKRARKGPFAWVAYMCVCGYLFSSPEVVYMQADRQTGISFFFQKEGLFFFLSQGGKTDEQQSSGAAMACVYLLYKSNS